MFRAISVVTVTGPITSSRGSGAPPVVTSLGSEILLPANAKPPKLSFTRGCVKLPPPTNENFSDKIFGNEFCCAARKTVPSEKPGVNELPTET